MTVTAITPQPISTSGTVVTLAAANVGGSTVPASNDVFLVVLNGSGGSINVTITSHATAVEGTTVADKVVAIAAGATKYIKLDRAAYRDPADGLIHIAYSAVTTVTVAAVQLH